MKLDFKHIEKALLDYNAKSELKQAAIIMVRNIFKEAETKQCDIPNVVGRSEQLTDVYKTELSNVKQLGQTQTSLNEQLQILRPFANKLGLYDASDYLRK